MPSRLTSMGVVRTLMAVSKEIATLGHRLTVLHPAFSEQSHVRFIVRSAWRSA